MIKITTIKISSSIFLDEQIVNLETFLLETVNKFSEELHLESLESIVITEDFFGDVVCYQRKYGLSELGATNNENAVAIAKVLKHIDDNSVLRQTVFFSDYIAAGLFDDRANTAYHFLHHELCHVHDNFHLNNIYTIEGKSGRNAHILDQMLRVHSDIIWSEYVVERLSISTIDIENIKTFLEHLTQLLKSTQAKIDQELSEYRYSHDINQLMKTVEEETSLLLKVAASLVGVLHGLKQASGSSVEEVYLMVEEMIKTNYPYFLDTWNGLNIELDALFNVYPNWNDVYELDSLGEVVLICWNDLGVFPEKQDDEMYVNVP